MPLAYLNMGTPTTNSKCASRAENGTRCVTLDIIPTDRTDVEYFSIINSQNDEVIEVEPTERSVTLCLEPGNVTFNITTEYICPFTSDPVQLTMEIPSESEMIGK